ncbi:TetR/AcrR family transcriptional regulator [uncultured Sphingomonas sp.]|uniref:TetR/AcrR family transcriptional regulator n=1 Tax=uncultured Sphingomonas sp. TaxID=158754 RepID=UPI0035CAB351
MAIKPPKPARRTQAERTAAMRTRIMEAAVRCLYRQGYGATTTVSVAATAEVSRGAMLHHFPSKADLMLATLTEVLELNAVNFTKAADKIADPWERYAALPDLRLEVALQPAGVAFMEIMVGARSDEAVRSRFAEFRQQLGARIAQRTAAWAESAGVKVTARDQAVSRTITLAVFGLAIQRQVFPSLDVDEVLGVLRQLKRDAMEPAAA